MASAITLIVAAALAVLAGASGEDALANKFTVTFSIFPDPFHFFSFYDMPRSIQQAVADGYVLDDIDNQTITYCFYKDYRVCVLFDNMATVAGIQVSVAVSEMQKSNIPIDLDNDEYWFRKTVLNTEVYSTVAYFVPESVLTSGGRPLEDSTPTAPEGIFIRSRTGRLHVTPKQENAEEKGFNKQACFRGMGLHYFQGLTKESKCEENKPYFLLYGPQTQQLNGFGITQFGKISQGRGWFETPPALVVGMIAPNSPPCLKQWVKKYGIFTMHVYFVDKPWKTRC